MIKVRVSNKGQITIPSQIRRKTGIKEGDRLALELEGEHIVLRPFTQTLLDLRGTVKVSNEQDFDAIRKQVVEERAVKAATGER